MNFLQNNEYRKPKIKIDTYNLQTLSKKNKIAA